MTTGSTLLLTLALMTGLAAACHEEEARPTAPLTYCPDIGIPTMVVSVRDQFGEAAAIGSTVVIESDSARASGQGYGDSLRISTEDPYGVPGTYRVTVSRPWHRTEVVEDVEVPGGACGVEEPYELDVEIERLDDTPAVRQVVLPPTGYGFGDGGLSVRLTAHVLRDPDASGAVAWSTTDPSVVTVDEEGRMTSACRDSPGEAWVIAESIADSQVRDSVAVGVHARPGDSIRCG